MCGIVAVLNFNQKPINKQLLVKMSRVLSHRGPDEEGIYCDRFLGIAHQRLSIIDLNSGQQPMCNQDQSLWIVANNEIYNYIELRKEMISRGHKFTTESDTEVILRLYEEMGESCVEKLVGMFAFCIWDRNKEKLFVARDQMGIKPLYYFKQNNVFACASELKSLLLHPALRQTLSPEALKEYFKYLYINDPQTIFSNVHKLPAGHFLTIKKNDFKIKRYWDISTPKSFPKKKEIVYQKELFSELQQSIALTLRSDVPVGVFLSGGVDSSIIAAVASKISSRPLKTFSVSFAEKMFDESPYSKQMAKLLGSKHYSLKITKDDATNILPKLFKILDQPFADSSCIPTFLLSELAAKHVKVVLTGEGGDELFAGYSWQKAAAEKEKSLSALINSPAKLIYNPSNHPLPLSKDFLKAIDFQSSKKTIPNLHKNIKAKNPLDRALIADLKTYLPSDMLVKLDRMTMANSLEGRVPFLNHPFVEYAMSIPAQFKFKGNIRKYILKKAFQKYLPSEIINRKKMGFAIPMDIWIWQKGSFRNIIYDTIYDKKTINRGLFDYKIVDRMFSEHDKLEARHEYRIWSIFVLEQWLRNYID